MSGQRKNYNEYERQMEEYIRTHPPYAPHEPCNIDLRGLSRYLKENNLSNRDVTPEILEKFSVNFDGND